VAGKMSTYTALCFNNKKDFEICNHLMQAGSEDTAVCEDGTLAVLVKTVGPVIPHGILAVTTSTGRKIFVRVTSGTEVSNH
jgi:hypothetical protein